MSSAPMKLIIAGFCLLTTAYNIKAQQQQQHQQQHHHQQQQQQQLQCWHCSSDTIGAEDFCDVTFQEDNIPTDLIKERNINLVRHCNSSINSDHERAVCRKTVDEANGKIITRRYCYYTNKSDPISMCNMTNTDKNVHRLFCEDCMTDRCNAATQLAIGMLAALVLPFLAFIEQWAN